MKDLYAPLLVTDNNAAFATAVADINKRGQALQLDIQRYLHAVAVRWKETGDVRPAVVRVNMLIDKKTLFKGVRRNAILSWIEINFGFEYVTEGDNKDHFHANKAKADRFNLKELEKQENHWYNMTPEPEYVPMDLNGLIAALVAKVDKRAANIKDGDAISLAQLNALKALVKTPEQIELEKAEAASEKAQVVAEANDALERGPVALAV